MTLKVDYNLTIAFHKHDAKSFMQCTKADISYGVFWCCDHFFNVCPPCRSDWILVTQVQDASFYWGMMIQLKTFLTTSVFRVLQILFHLNSEVILRRNYIVEDKLASWHLSCPDQTIWPTSKKELPVAYEGCWNCSERANQHRSHASS